MNEIVISVIIVGIIGLTCGIILSISSIVMSVKKDEKIEKILEILPGANCGACGFSGCEGYAKALAEGKAKVGLCSPGGQKVSNEISKILGVKEESSECRVAFIHCCGTSDKTSKKYDYHGISSCSAANMLSAGPSKCQYGCIGFGDCLNVCEFGAISICDGVAKVDQNKCVACGKCIDACPKKLISFIKVKPQAIVSCSNHDAAANTFKNCKAGCVACKRCVKECPQDAISIKNSLAYVDKDKCIGCGKCVKVCKIGCIKLLNIK